MALTASSYLAFANFTSGSIEVLGMGPPQFTRAGADWMFDWVLGRYVSISAGIPNLSGEFHPAQYRCPFLRVPPSAAQELQGTNLVDSSATDWSAPGDFTIAAVESIFDGEIAYRHLDKIGGASNSREQTIGSWSGDDEFTMLIVENVDATTTSIESRDAVGQELLADFTWATDGVATTGSGTAGVRVLSERGPNGGRVVLLWLRSNGTGTRTIRVYPVDRGSDTTNAVIIHHIGHLETGQLGTPVVRAAAAVTRPAAELFYGGLSAPIVGLAVYLNFILGGEPDTTQRAIWSIGSTTGTGDPSLRLLVNASGGGTIEVEHDNNVDAPVSSAVMTLGLAGERVEALALLKSDGKVRLIGVKNDDSILDSTDSAAPASGLAANWASPQGITLGNKGNLTDLSSVAYGTIKVLKIADLASAIDGTANAALMEEVRLAHMTPDGHHLVLAD